MPVGGEGERGHTRKYVEPEEDRRAASRGRHEVLGPFHGHMPPERLGRHERRKPRDGDDPPAIGEHGGGEAPAAHAGRLEALGPAVGAPGAARPQHALDEPHARKGSFEDGRWKAACALDGGRHDRPLDVLCQALHRKSFASSTDTSVRTV
jgi:hypothetical protein